MYRRLSSLRGLEPENDKGIRRLDSLRYSHPSINVLIHNSKFKS